MQRNPPPKEYFHLATPLNGQFSVGVNIASGRAQAKMLRMSFPAALNQQNSTVFGPTLERGGIDFPIAPEKTRQTYNEQGWASYGDIGYVDEEGFLYLTDRLANMIISGGVNIYPQETEDVLLQHPAVADVAVFGVPNEEFGEEVKAVVQLQAGTAASEELKRSLIDYCRDQLSALKCPKSVDFAATLPRTETGKLMKSEIRNRYRAAQV